MKAAFQNRIDYAREVAAAFRDYVKNNSNYLLLFLVKNYYF